MSGPIWEIGEGHRLARERIIEGLDRILNSAMRPGMEDLDIKDLRALNKVPCLL